MKQFISISLVVAFLCSGLFLLAQNTSWHQSSNRLIRVHKDGSFGYIDIKGKTVIPCQYRFALGFTEGLACVSDNDWMLGFIDKMGKTVIPFIYDFNSSPNTVFSDEHVCVVKDKKYCILNKTGKQTGSMDKGIYAYGRFKEGMIVLHGGYDNGDLKMGFADTTGKLVIPLIYDEAQGFSDGLAFVEKDGKGGYINQQGETVIPFIYESGGPFSEGLAVVMKGRSYYIIDKTGKAVANLAQNVMCIMPEFKDGLINISIDKYDGPSGFANQEGEIVIPCVYESVYPFSEGLACVQINGKFGYIDKTGEMVFPCIYDYAESFSDGIAVVQKDGVFGLLDKAGSIISLGQYDSVGDYVSEEMEGDA